MLTQKLVRDYYDYDPVNGILIRRDLPNPKPISGVYASVKGELHTTARIIYCYMMGDTLPKLILRIDKDPSNNKWNNFTTTVPYATNKRTGKARIRPSAQKRPVVLTKQELKEWFIYDEKTKELWFIKDGANKLVQKNILTLRGNRYPKVYIVRRMKQIQNDWEDMFKGY